VNRCADILVICAAVASLATLTAVPSDAATINVPGDYPTIQEAVDAADPGDSILVAAGTYPETVTITEEVILKGENRETTTIQGPAAGNTVTVYADGTEISGFSITNSGSTYPESGLFLDTAGQCVIKDINASNNGGFGIFAMWAEDNVISENLVTYNGYCGIRVDMSRNYIFDNTCNSNTGDGVFMYGASGSVLDGNLASLNGEGGISAQGIFEDMMISENLAADNLKSGILLYAGVDCEVVNNTSMGNGWSGVDVGSSSGVTIEGNYLAMCTFHGIKLNASDGCFAVENHVRDNLGYGIKLAGCTGTTIYNNDILGNWVQSYDDAPEVNDWFHPLLMQGNFWGDYAGLDDGSGSGIHDFSGDHIGDTAIPHPETGFDSCPFVIEAGWTRPYIVIYPDAKTYSAGDTIVLRLIVVNPGPAETVAVSIWVDLPNGGKYPLAEAPALTLPSGITYDNPSWMSRRLPAIPQGEYACHALLEGSVTSESIEPWTFN